MTSLRSEILGQNDVPSLIFRFVLSLPGPTNQLLVRLFIQKNAAKRSIPVTEGPKVSPRLQSNPQVPKVSPQVDTEVAPTMVKVAQSQSHHRHCVAEPLVHIMLWVAGGNCAPQMSLLNASAITATAADD